MLSIKIPLQCQRDLRSQFNDTQPTITMGKRKRATQDADFSKRPRLSIRVPPAPRKRVNRRIRTDCKSKRGLLSTFNAKRHTLDVFNSPCTPADADDMTHTVQRFCTNGKKMMIFTPVVRVTIADMISKFVPLCDRAQMKLVFKRMGELTPDLELE
jgi:hypothetical protein